MMQSFDWLSIVFTALLVISLLSGLRRGFFKQIADIAGILLGDLVWFTCAALGLAALAQTYAGVFTVIRWVGVAYLFFLGVIHVLMPKMTQLDENLRAMAEPWTPADERLLTARLERIRPDYCSMCGQCEGVCPKGLPVADVLRYLTYAEGYGQFALGRLSEGSAQARHAIAGGSTAECHAVRGYRFDQPSASGSGCRATWAGVCPGADKPDGSGRSARGYVDAQTTLRTCPCDRHWFRRPTALSDATRRETETAAVGGRKEGEG